MLLKPISVIFILSLLLPIILSVRSQREDSIITKSPVSLWDLGYFKQLPSLKNNESTIRVSDKLQDVLQRPGPNIRASSDYHDFEDIYLNESLEAWQLMGRQAEIYAREQVQYYKPRIMSSLREANVSEICEAAVNLTFDALEHLNSWSVKMWSSSGSFPPVGLFDGTLTDLGSYYGCLDAIKNPKLNYNVGYTSYCMVSFRPVIPSRPMNHQVFNKVSSKLLHNFNESNIFYDLAQEAQYYHYFYLKWGICVPYQCSPEDVQRVAILKGSQSFAMMSGPVKCYTNAPPSKQAASVQASQQKVHDSYIEFGKIEDEPILIELSRSMNRFQLISLILVASFFGLVFLSTIWHGIELLKENFINDYAYKAVNQISVKIQSEKPEAGEKQHQFEEKVSFMNHLSKPMNEKESTTLKYVAFEYFSAITNTRDALNCKSVKSPTEIKCLHGIRVLTMIWVISVHVLQYNEWDGFTRIYENVKVLQDIALHPIYNASYVVDNFFLMSGLLASYTILLSHKRSSSSPSNEACKGEFNFGISLLSRYLRLTPQVLLVSLLYTLLPLTGQGPFWYDMTHYTAKYCEKNWWINLLHLQSFYRKDEICNLVGWWISVDMFYYIFALLFLTMIINCKNTGRAFLSTLILSISFHAFTAYKHYINGYTPNNLGTVPQVGNNWTGFVVDFFWSPYAHVIPFYLGFWCGYLLAYDTIKIYVQRYQFHGWTISTITLIVVNFSSHVWMSGYWALDNQVISTLYNGLCPIAWALSFAWIVIALHYDCGPKWCNKFLSTKLLVILSRASFIVYLSHMLLLRFYFGIQISLIEVSKLNLIFVALSCTFLSIIIGLFLNITFEGPCLKFQRFLIKKVKTANSRSSLDSNSNQIKLQNTSSSYNETNVKNNNKEGGVSSDKVARKLIES